MTVYVTQYDPLVGFYSSPVEASDVDDYSYAMVFNYSISSPTLHHDTSMYEANKSVSILNSKLSNGDIEILKCKSCHRWFMTSKRQVNWFVSRNLASPKRCECCRKS